MLDAFTSLNWLGVLAGTAVFAVLGYVWFVVLFAKQYRRALGRPVDEAPSTSPLVFAGPPLTGLIMVITSGILINALAIETIGGALAFGALVGIGYLGAMTVTIAINPNFPYPLRYAALNIPYFIIAIMLASVLLVLIG